MGIEEHWHYDPSPICPLSAVHCPLSTVHCPLVCCVSKLIDWLKGLCMDAFFFRGETNSRNGRAFWNTFKGTQFTSRKKKWAAVNTCFNEIVFKKLLNVKDILFHLKNIFSTPPGNFFLPPLNLSKWIPILILQLRLFSILCVCIEVMYYLRLFT